VGASRGGGQSPGIECKHLHISYEVGQQFPTSIKEFSPEAVIHLAWSGIPDFSAETCFENVSSQISFLNELAKLPNLKKILVAGSCKEYGSSLGRCVEGERFLPDGYFSWAKQTLCDYFHVFCRENGVELLWFRIFYVYGLGQRPGSLVPMLIKALRAGEMPEIKNPKASNDFIYIDDVIDGFIKGLECDGARGIFNLGTGHLTSVDDVSRLVRKAEQSERMSMSEGEAFRASEEVQIGMYADIELARLHLGWMPRTSLQEGIRQMLGVVS